MQATGFFRTARVEDRWWLVTPDGRRFLSLGVNHISGEGYFCPRLGYSPYQRSVEYLYGGTEGWARMTRDRLLSWGFTTVGAWSDYARLQPFPYTLVLNLALLGGADWQSGQIADVFNPQWEQAVREHCQKVCAPLRDDPYLVGYFTDNELRWGPDWRGLESLLTLYLQKPAGSAGRQVAEEFLKTAWGTRREKELEFAGIVAERYFAVTSKALRESDPRHLNLGARFHAGSAPPAVLRAAGKYVDVISVNYYDMFPRLVGLIIRFLGNVPQENQLMNFYALTGKPLLLTEFSYRAVDSGLPNTKGAGSVVLTQGERARRFERYARWALAAPYIVGYHWFNYMDEPFWGRFDGENGNYGLVNGEDQPYPPLVEKMKLINGEACALHAGAVPTPVPP